MNYQQVYYASIIDYLLLCRVIKYILLPLGAHCKAISTFDIRQLKCQFSLIIINLVPNNKVI